MTKCKQVVANVVEFKVSVFNEINELVSDLEEETLRISTMSLERKGEDMMFVAIECF